MLDRYLAAGGVVELADNSEEATLEKLLDDRSETARRVVDETVEYLGAGLADLLNLFNPELIVIGGWAGLMLAQRRMDDIVAASRRLLAQSAVPAGADSAGSDRTRSPRERRLW